MKIRSLFFTEMRGTLGKAVTASVWKGHQYLRTYRPPSNPRTKPQVRHREVFGAAIGAWKAMPRLEREFYNALARRQPMSGYNLFVARAVKALRTGGQIETPTRIACETPDGSARPDVLLTVRTANRIVFEDWFRLGRAEAALTASDAPYSFELWAGKGTASATMVRLPVAGVSHIIGSGNLRARVSLPGNDGGPARVPRPLHRPKGRRRGGPRRRG